MIETRVYDESSPGGSLDFDLLEAELTLALAQAGSGAVCVGVTIDDAQPVGSRLLVAYSEALDAPGVAATDPVILAHPSAEDADGAIAVSSGVSYEIGRRVLQVGDCRVWDVHVAAHLGDQSDFQPVWIDAYPQTYRRTTGDVQIDRPNIREVGSIPGFDLEVTGTATEAVFSVKMRKNGTLTIRSRSITVKEGYEVPA